MPAELAEGEVLVTLSCLDPTTFTFPQRRLLLSNQKRAVSLGRASKRSATLEPRMYNGWIDAPVMSRQHAELKLDSQSQTVFVRDVGSLHGTYHNETKLRQGVSQALVDGDVLKFGIPIERASERFPECIMKVGLEFGNSSSPSLPKPAIFQVPDESDCEESESQASFSSMDEDDDQDSALRMSVATLRGKGLELSEFHGFESDPIDLTSEPDLVSEDNIGASSSAPTEDSDPPIPIHNTTYTIDSIHMLAPLDEERIPLTGAAFAPAAQYKEMAALEMEENRDPGPGAFPDEESYQPRAHEVTRTPVEILGELSGKTEFFEAREQNKSFAQSLVAEFSPEKHDLPATQAPDEAQVAETGSKNDSDPVQHISEVRNLDNQSVTESLPHGLSKKRKADEISGLNALETVDSVGTNSAANNQSAPPADVNAGTVFKKMRTAAEYFGFVAIGGAAVMTALIATAPNL